MGQGPRSELRGLLRLASALPIEACRDGILRRQGSEWKAVASHRNPKAGSRAFRLSGQPQWGNVLGLPVADTLPDDAAQVHDTLHPPRYASGAPTRNRTWICGSGNRCSIR